MTALEAEAASASYETDEQSEEDDVMNEGSALGGQQRLETSSGESSIMSISSRITSDESASTIRATSEVSTVRAVSDNEQ